MKTLLFGALGLGTALMLALSGCGGSGGGAITDSPKSTASVTTGTITGFGSVIVNGVKFSRKSGLPDDRVKLRFENNTSASENNLRIGMIVTIKGAVNTGAGVGEYESIEFQPETRGPLDTASVDTAANTLTIMGRTIKVEPGTSFDNVRDLAEIKSEHDLGNRPELEISGTLDSTGVLHATRIGRKAAHFTDGEVELKGMIADVPPPTSDGFSIGSQAIVVDNSTVFRDMARSDIAAGVMVEVKGNLNAGVFTATKIEKKYSVEAEVDENVHLKGTAAGAIDNNIFTLNGPNGPIQVTTASALFISNRAPATSAMVFAGATLEVEGTLQADGSVKATKVSAEIEQSVKLEGNALSDAYSATSNTLTLNGVMVSITTVTRLIDRDGAILDLASIAAGDHLQIYGVLDNATGTVSASQVQRTNPDSTSYIKGPVSSVAFPDLTILGVNIVTSSVATQFQKSDDIFMTQVDFFASVTPGVTVIKAKGMVNGATMTAVRVEIED